jgi:hypothetical protein
MVTRDTVDTVHWTIDDANPSFPTNPLSPDKGEMDIRTQAEEAQAFRALGTAKLLARMGFEALATTSSGRAQMLGRAGSSCELPSLRVIMPELAARGR